MVIGAAARGGLGALFSRAIAARRASIRRPSLEADGFKRCARWPNATASSSSKA